MTFVYKADPAHGAQWARLFAEKAPDVPFRVWPDVGDPAAVRYLAAWQPPDDPLRPMPNLEVVFSVGASVDQLAMRDACKRLGILFDRREDFDRFVAAIRNVDEIVECHLASGGYDCRVSHDQTIIEGLLERNIGIESTSAT
ncbi:hypothetical protein WS71_00095 [Burkholderia mayonis]|uniref:Transcription regulator AsnC/Lrp ligand binding domain-containing protein n=1 Tax=Burkholderia mayonis TaxID=1385591 RepID=A0A1B4FQE7_9BURK|nr:hypothetical protein WS71_00095 [Burkholderia mayonis]KVE56246.1 hypothetical protein WS71_29000 [Burkholderia mayonis]